MIFSAAGCRMKMCQGICVGKPVMQFAETKLGMKECVTAYAKVNTASANVLHKLGFVDEKEIPYECNGGDIITEGILSRYVKNK